MHKHTLRSYVGTQLLLALAVTLTGAACASYRPPIRSDMIVVDESQELSGDLAELKSVLRADLARTLARRPPPPVPAQPTSTVAIPQRPRPVISLTGVLSLRMPVMGISNRNLEDNFGDPRDGGRRRHRGLDIFAPRGAKVVAVTSGVITFIGEQPKAGRCIWLSSENGMSFFYAHLDRWRPGLYEGMEVREGTVLGYVGTTGNARHTPPHLHFTVIRNDDAVDPFPLLTARLPRGDSQALRGGLSSTGSR